ncbi:MAG: PAS domain-containing sensor histidine kinase, partial [Halobacteriaceae archaeon]
QQEAILDGIVVVNENHELVSYNDQFVEMLGIPQEIIKHEGTESVLEWMAEKLDNPQEFRERAEHLFKHPEKTERGEISFSDGRVFEEYTTSIMGANDSYYGRLWMFRNITQQKERERELQQSHELINALSTTFPDYTFIYNENGTYLDVITGWDEGPSLYTKDEIIGKSIDDLLSSDTASQIHDAIQTTLETGNLQTLEYTLETPGGVYWYEGHLAPLPEGYEGEPAVLLSARDITDRKEYEQELERQNNRLERFASVVSHDLRNPLNVATGRLALAKEECSSDQLQKVAQALKRMDALIDDTLTLARQGRTIDETTPVPLEDVVDTAWRTASTNNATLSVENNLGTIEGDTNRIKELLENLFRNAAKHGGNDVTITVGDLDSGFYVEDDGPGIPDEKQDEIFEHGYTTSDEGTGFGLSIVEEITNAHGWDISVTTSPSGGAQFEITSVEFIEES